MTLLMRLAILGLTSIAVPVWGAQYSMELSARNTQVAWTLGDVLHTVRGTFQLKSGVIEFNDETGASSGRIIIDMMSGNSGNAARDRKMHSAVLESEKYPEAVFTPERIEGKLDMRGASRVKLSGSFRIHGDSHPLTMNIQANVHNGAIAATVSFDIPYVAWGMKDPSNFLLKVNKIVSVSMECSARYTGTDSGSTKR